MEVIGRIAHVFKELIIEETFPGYSISSTPYDQRRDLWQWVRRLINTSDHLPMHAIYFDIKKVVSEK